MCGIAGAAGKIRVTEKELCSALSVMRNRGPDGSGVFMDDGAALAHTRLAILDSAGDAGSQPMRDPSGRYVIVHNGEVGNFSEIRTDLEKSGIRFFSGTDTEVILAAYILRGERCLDDFSGMFAFAVWDRLEKSLFFARDRLGIKPFYYAEKNGCFYFGSQPRAITALGFGPVSPNPQALAYFLQFRHNDLDETIFRGVMKLQPGHRGTFKNGRAEISPWWTLPRFGTGDGSSRPEELGALLESAVKTNLLGDGATGLFLSGGLDSSGLLAIMSESERPVHTFTVEMDGLGASGNLPALSERFGNVHHPVAVDAEACRLLPEIVWHYDELNADPASIPLYLLAREAARHVKAVCAGEGADELFGGYERIYILNALRLAGRMAPKGLLQVLPEAMRLAPKKLMDGIFPYYSMLMPEGLDRLKILLADSANPRKSYLALQSVIMPHEMKGLILSEHLDQGSIEALAEGVMAPWVGAAGNREGLPELLRFELAKRLATDLLMKSDAMTMAHGLECRVPYLDHRVVEFAARIPMDSQVGLGGGKKFLRAALKPRLPERVVRQKKENFFVPIHHWLASLNPLTEAMLSEKNIRRQWMFDPKRVGMLVERYRSGKLYYARIVWNLLTYALWHEIFMERGGAFPEGERYGGDFS